jgi:hypothetical protein
MRFSVHESVGNDHPLNYEKVIDLAEP